MREPLLVARAVSKTVRDGARRVQILREVSLQIGRGEKVALVGPSGSGKSTLLHVLGALDTDYGGSVTLAGRDLSAMSEAALASFRNRAIGFIFQAYNLLGHLSVVDNVMLPARFGAGRGDAARARELLCTVGLGEHGHRRPSTLSGGERQRVAIARALYQKPDLVLCDEPTGNLDSATGREVISLFERLRDDGVALLIATHDEAVARAADRTIHIAGGILQ